MTDCFLLDVDGSPDDNPVVAVEVLARVVNARVLCQTDENPLEFFAMASVIIQFRLFQ